MDLLALTGPYTMCLQEVLLLFEKLWINSKALRDSYTLCLFMWISTVDTDGFSMRIGSLCTVLPRHSRLLGSSVRFYICFWCFILGLTSSELHLSSQLVISSNELELQLKILPIKSWPWLTAVVLFKKGFLQFQCLLFMRRDTVDVKSFR